jgi:homoserine O-acetyltransferase
VIAQHRLVTEELGLSELHLVLGWSIGALQVYEWALRFPEMTRRIAPLAGAPTPPPWTRLWLSTVVEEPITSDPNWAGGGYESAAQVRDGLTRVARAAALTAPPRTFYYDSSPGWRSIGFGSVAEYVAGFWESFWTPQDPNDVLVQARKGLDSYPGPRDEPLAQILGRITARTTIAAFTGDALFPPAESRQFADAIPGATFTQLDTEFGHLATFGLSERDVKAIDDVIRAALDS